MYVYWVLSSRLLATEWAAFAFACNQALNAPDIASMILRRCKFYECTLLI